MNDKKETVAHSTATQKVAIKVNPTQVKSQTPTELQTKNPADAEVANKRAQQKEIDDARKIAEAAAVAAAARGQSVAKAGEATAKGVPGASSKSQPKKRHGKFEINHLEITGVTRRVKLQLLHERARNFHMFVVEPVRFLEQGAGNSTTFEAVLYVDPDMFERQIQNMIKMSKDEETALMEILVIVVGPAMNPAEGEKAYGYVRKSRAAAAGQTLSACLCSPQSHFGIFSGEKEARNSLRAAHTLAMTLKMFHDKGIVFHGSLDPEIIVVNGDLVSQSGKASTDTHLSFEFKDLSASTPCKLWSAPELQSLCDKSWKERTTISGNNVAAKKKEREQADIFTLGAILLALCDGKLGFFEEQRWYECPPGELDRLLLKGRKAGNIPNFRILAELLVKPDAGLKGKINLQRVIDYLADDESRLLGKNSDAAHATATRENIAQFLLSSSAGATKISP